MKKFQISEMGKQNEKVVFLLAGWHSKLWMFWLFSKILKFKGFFCITYAYDSDVFSPDTQKTVRLLNEIKDDILLRITALKKDGYKDFYIFGTSLGSIIGLMVADKSSDVSKVILNTTGIDISESVWGWDKVNPSFKKRLLKQNLTLKKLKEKWRSITPGSNINHLSHKKLLIYISEKDEIIPIDLGKRLVKEFQKRKYNYKLITNSNLNHSATGVYNLFNAGHYLTFLKS